MNHFTVLNPFSGGKNTLGAGRKGLWMRKLHKATGSRTSGMPTLNDNASSRSLWSDEFRIKTPSKALQAANQAVITAAKMIGAFGLIACPNSQMNWGGNHLAPNKVGVFRSCPKGSRPWIFTSEGPAGASPALIRRLNSKS